MSYKTTVYATVSSSNQRGAAKPANPQVAGTSDVATTELSEPSSDGVSISLRLVAIILGSVVAAALFIVALYVAMTRLLRK